jgi:hypothetical protein
VSFVPQDGLRPSGFGITSEPKPPGFPSSSPNMREEYVRAYWEAESIPDKQVFSLYYLRIVESMPSVLGSCRYCGQSWTSSLILELMFLS